MSTSTSVARNETELLLNQLDLRVTGTIVVMVCRMWDVHAATRRYLSTDLIVSDAKNFTVVPNKDKFRVMRFAELMLEFDGETTVQKSFVKSDALLALSLNKYPTNVAGCDQCWGQQIRVTLWGGLGDMLIQKRTCHVGLYPVVITVVLVKLYNQLTKEILSANNTAPKAGTLENLLMWARNQKYDSSTFLCEVKIDKVRTKKGWNYPSCGGENVGRVPSTARRGVFGVTCAIAQWSTLYRLDLEISDDTGKAVVVMFDETATSLLGCSASCILDSEEQEYFLAPYNLTNTFTYLHLQDEEDHLGLPTALANIKVVTTEDGEGGEGYASSGTVAANKASKAFVLKRVSKIPSVATPLKPEGVEDSNAEGSFIADNLPKGGDMACSSNTRKRKRSAKTTHALPMA
ncbi:retrovirus-related pol polyprotein from transposon TNT 1-94 [Tanacetum coccineum]